jgi:4-coumarate--CoA ligase
VQEILKVRGFQVAPEHPDVTDTCVVGVPDDYSGEVPFAFVVLSADAAKRALRSEAEVAKIKATMSKVCPIFICCSRSVKRSD